MRKKIDLSMSLQDIIVLMAEGNPGGLTTLIKLVKLKGDDAFLSLLALDDMNIRGSQIWVGYKDFAGEDINEFHEAIHHRQQEMIVKINSVCVEETAVIGGASWER
jgi:hypothetical protein